jgi:outer membrane protein assembly factor BamB
MSTLSATPATVAMTVVCVVMLSIGVARAQLPEGVVDHGVVAPVFVPGGQSTVAVQDADGRNVVFIKLWVDKTEPVSYLFIDAETGETDQISPGMNGGTLYPVQYCARENVIYDAVDQSLMEIDVLTRKVRRVATIPDGMVASFTVDADGVIYGGMRPSATVFSYNPATGELRDYGAVNEEDWPQILRPMVVDRYGWVYGGIGQALMQFIGLNPRTGEVRQFIPHGQRERGICPKLGTGTDGEVYSHTPIWGWHRLSNGEATALGKPQFSWAPDTAASESRCWTFPDGARIVGNVRGDVPNRRLKILDAGAEEPRELTLDYDSPGARIHSMIEGPDGRIYGSTGIPLRIWRFDPETAEMRDGGLDNHMGHVNQWVRQGDLLYGGLYGSGSLVVYDPAQPHDDAPMLESTNPLHLHGEGAATDLYGRPLAMLAHPDGRHVVMGGNPHRILTGSGMLIYDTQTSEEMVLDRTDLIPDQGVYSMAALPNGDLIVGTTTAAGTGGTDIATEAVIYRLDWQTKTITQRWTLDPPTTAITDLVVAGDGLVYGMAWRLRFFVLDPEGGDFVHEETMRRDYSNAAGHQAPRSMAVGPDGGIYMLFRRAIVRVEPGTFEQREIVRSGVYVSAGIVISGGRIYFASGSRLYSYDLGL